MPSADGDVRPPRFVVRPAVPSDGPALYEVCLLTGESGDDATSRYDDPLIVGHVYVGPYLALQPELAFVVDDGGGACGYVLGALDTAAFERDCEQSWWPALRHRYPLPAPAVAAAVAPAVAAPDTQGPNRPDPTWDARLVQIIHHPWSAPRELVKRYPSHLHIDLLPRAWGMGHGRTLIELLCEQLTVRGSSGVHLVVGSRNTRAQAFYAKVGFTVLGAEADGITMVRSLP